METRYISLNDAVQCANDLAEDFAGEGLDSASHGAQAVAEWLKDIPAAAVVEKTEWDKLMFLVDAANNVLESAPKWIPVNERMPENGTRCLVVRYDYVTNTPFVDVLWFDNSWWNRINSGDYAVTHWMPLPQSPKEGGGTL